MEGLISVFENFAKSFNDSMNQILYGDKVNTYENEIKVIEQKTKINDHILRSIKSNSWRKNI